MFNPTRLTLARMRRGRSKTALAGAIGVDLRSVTAYEDADFAPSVETLSSIAKELKFPVQFFGGPDVDIPTPKTASFRSLARRTAAQRDAALGAGAIAFLLNDWLERRFKLPPVNFSDVVDASPEGAAIDLRNRWGLGELPIKHLLQLLEANGIRVFSLGEMADEIDAFSLWRNDTPFIFLNTSKSAERGRFDAAHELGHLVLHRQGPPEGRQAEDEANAFASAFLMPERGIRASCKGLLGMPNLLVVKRHWGVSAMALAFRLHKIGAITEWHYKTLCFELASRGYRKGEPDGLERERSRLLERVFEALRKAGTSKTQLCDDLQLYSNELDGLVFGLVTIALEGGRTTSTVFPRSAGHLKIVK